MQHIVYTSPVFSNADGSGRKFWIPSNALATYAKRDECLLKMDELGGIYAKPTPEFMKIRSKMLAARRKIQREGWFSSPIV